jgi:hypothetical protein
MSQVAKPPLRLSAGITPLGYTVSPLSMNGICRCSVAAQSSMSLEAVRAGTGTCASRSVSGKSGTNVPACRARRWSGKLPGNAVAAGSHPRSLTSRVRMSKSACLLPPVPAGTQAMASSSPPSLGGARECCGSNRGTRYHSSPKPGLVQAAGVVPSVLQAAASGPSRKRREESILRTMPLSCPPGAEHLPRWQAVGPSALRRIANGGLSGASRGTRHGRSGHRRRRYILTQAAAEVSANHIRRIGRKQHGAVNVCKCSYHASCCLFAA